MASTRQFVRSWSGGEIAPELFGRLDDARYQQGAEKLRNFICRVGGSLQRRPGFDFVRETKDSTKASRLIPFVYSTGQAYAVEMGEGYFRFHADGATLLHVVASKVASVDTGAETITFTQPHGWTSNMPVRFFTSGTIPTGITAGTTYYAIPVDTHTVQVSASAGPGAAVNITGAGVAPIYGYEVADCPALYVSSKNITTGIGTDYITTASPHTFATGDAFTISDPGVLSAPLVENQVYYAIYIDATNIRAATSLANANANVYENITGIDSGTARIHKYYQAGDLVTNINAPQGFYSCRVDDPQDVTPGSDPDTWHQLSLDGVFEIPNDYDESDLFAVHYAQSADVKTLVHQSYPPSELRRRGPIEWDFNPIVFNGGIDAPASASMTPTSGYVVSVTSVTNSGTGSAAVFTTNGAEASTDNFLAEGDLVYLEQPSGSAIGTDVATNTFYVIGPAPTATTFTLVSVSGGGRIETSSTTMPASVRVRVFSATSDTAQYYRVTAVDSEGRESAGSGSTGGVNNILAPGALNTITWTASIGADRYNIYKARNGLYGYIGTTTALSFVDDNIAPDMTTTLPLFDTSLDGVDYPGSVAYFEGRRVFGGTSNQPQTVWMTNVSLTDSLAYHIPVQDTDRIVFQPDSIEASKIEHLVPTQFLVAITSSTEYRIGGINSDAIAPDSISVRPQSYVGGSSVQPVVVNRTIVFVAYLGGHLFEMGYTANDGYQPADLCLRSPHLFDDTTVVDMAYVKSPVPSIWAVSSDGRLLGCTYAPEEQVGGWHVHETQSGTFESVCAIPEADEYRLYAIVNRTIDGATVRNVERMNSVKTPATIDEARYVDGGGQFYGLDTTGTTITVTPASSWASGSAVTIASGGAPIFRVGSTDVGDKVLFRYLSRDFVATITSVASGVSASATLDQTVTDATNTQLVYPTVGSIPGISYWGWKRDSLSGLDHLEGEEVQLLADGVFTTATVSSGAITGLTPAFRITYGLPIASELLTLPLLYGSDSYGQARTGAISEVWLRTRRTETFQIAQGESGEQVPFAADFDDAIAVDRCMPRGRWDETGQLYVYQDEPYPLTLVSMTIKASIGS